MPEFLGIKVAFTLSGDKLTARVGSRSDNELSVMISLVCGRGGLVPDEGLALQTLGQSGQFGWILEHHDIPLHLPPSVPESPQKLLRIWSNYSHRLQTVSMSLRLHGSLRLRTSFAASCHFGAQCALS